MRIVDTYPGPQTPRANEHRLSERVLGTRFIPCHNRATAQHYVDNPQLLEASDWETTGWERSPFYVID